MTAFRHIFKAPLQILLQKPSHHRKQMQASITPVDTMIFVGIIERLELFIGFDEGIFKGYWCFLLLESYFYFREVLTEN
jgi:hypothetical protein